MGRIKEMLNRREEYILSAVKNYKKGYWGITAFQIRQKIGFDYYLILLTLQELEKEGKVKSNKIGNGLYWRIK